MCADCFWITGPQWSVLFLLRPLGRSWPQIEMDGGREDERQHHGADEPADDGDGAIIKLLDVRGTGRAVGIWPAAYGFQLARRTNLVEMNGEALTVGSDRSASLDLKTWGIAAARLFTPRESAG